MESAGFLKVHLKVTSGILVVDGVNSAVGPMVSMLFVVIADQVLVVFMKRSNAKRKKNGRKLHSFHEPERFHCQPTPYSLQFVDTVIDQCIF